MLAAVTQEAIEAAVNEWVREVAIDPRTGVPSSAGGFEITDYRQVPGRLFPIRSLPRL